MRVVLLSAFASLPWCLVRFYSSSSMFAMPVLVLVRRAMCTPVQPCPGVEVPLSRLAAAFAAALCELDKIWWLWDTEGSRVPFRSRESMAIKQVSRRQSLSNKFRDLKFDLFLSMFGCFFVSVMTQVCVLCILVLVGAVFDFVGRAAYDWPWCPWWFVSRMIPLLSGGPGQDFDSRFPLSDRVVKRKGLISRVFLSCLSAIARCCWRGGKYHQSAPPDLLFCVYGSLRTLPWRSFVRDVCASSARLYAT